MRITVLAGGPSAERDVSLVSGRAIADALRRRGHDVLLADIGPDDLAALDHPADAIFPALHGTWGEDGQLQQILESRKLPFVGSGSQASAVAMDKVQTKQIVAAMNIDTPEWQVITRAEDLKFAVPFVVKPIDQGSSVATTVVREPAELRAAIDRCLSAFGRALIERFIVGDELTVGLLAGDPLPPIVIRPKRDFYDYDAKYHDNATEYLFDADLPAAVYAQARDASAAIFQKLGCRHLGRVDWMVDRGHRLWFLEVNTLPGFTSHSLVPKAAAHVGISFDDLCDRLARMATTDRGDHR